MKKPSRNPLCDIMGGWLPYLLPWCTSITAVTAASTEFSA